MPDLCEIREGTRLADEESQQGGQAGFPNSSGLPQQGGDKVCERSIEVGGGLMQPVQIDCQDGARNGAEQLPLGRKVNEERALGDTGAARNIFQLRGAEPALDEQVERRLDDLAGPRFLAALAAAWRLGRRSVEGRGLLLAHAPLFTSIPCFAPDRSFLLTNGSIIAILAAMARTGAAPLTILMLLGACTAGPSYAPPKMAVPPSYGSAQPKAVSDAPLETWWTAFGDPVLDSLMTRALAGNLDVQQAAARVRQARAQELATRRAGGPQANISAQGGYTRLSENSLPSALADLGGADSGQSGGSGLGFPGEGFSTFQTGFDASWEIDLFGGRRRANEAARARSEAAVWSQRDAEVMLAAEVARSYQQYRALQRRIAIADETLAAERELLDFVTVRTAKGLVTTLDERRQQQDVAAVAAQCADLAAQAEARLHGLATLLGLAPTALSAELTAVPSAAPTTIAIPAGLPSDLLQRRPDIRAAERRLAAATADIGVATADLYPRFSLTGALQLASRSLSSLLESDSILANGAGRLSMPLLGRGAKRAAVQLREAQADEALLAYQADVLTALRDVEDALTRLDADRQRVGHLRASAQAADDAADTAAVRYRNGLTSYLDVLEARQSLLSARDALAQGEAATAQDEVALYKTLGGGWDERRIETGEDVPHG